MKDKVIIITGASAGIGAEMARQLGRMGARLSLAARDENRMRDIAVNFPGTLCVPTDVSNPEQCQRLIGMTVEHFGRLDILVNNAGISMWTNFEDVKDLTIFEKIMDVNYLGSLYCTYYALPHLKSSKGLIVAVSSLAGKTGVPTRTGYAASKHAMHGLFDSLRVELMGTGVDVSIVCPDFVTSEIRERAFDGNGQPLGKSPVKEAEVMSTEECARQIIEAISARKRELIMGRRGKLGQWLKLLAPKVVDRIARRAIERGK